MVIFNIEEKDRDKTLKLSQQTGLKIVDQIPNDFYFTFDDGALIVKNPLQGPQFKLSVDIKKEWKRLKSQKINYKKDLLCRAMGFKGQEDYKVFDGTLGFAKDALHLLSVGCKIIGVEKNPIVFALLQDAIQREELIAKSIKIEKGDSFEIIQNYINIVDCLYLDPMFENASKKSAPKKEMAFLRAVNSTTDNVQRVMERAHELGVKRIVVKRPISGENLSRKPNNTFKGKLIRFDVYIK